MESPRLCKSLSHDRQVNQMSQDVPEAPFAMDGNTFLTDSTSLGCIGENGRAVDRRYAGIQWPDTRQPRLATESISPHYLTRTSAEIRAFGSPEIQIVVVLPMHRYPWRP
jgi:hypothetical protein